MAGECRLDNAISRVNIMEVPDIQNWAQANEFLVTTGYSHHHNMDAFLEIIPRLVERGVAALGIKPKRFITDIPGRLSTAPRRMNCRSSSCRSRRSSPTSYAR